MCLNKGFLRSLPERVGEAWNSSKKEMGSLYLSLQLKQKKQQHPFTAYILTLIFFYYSIEQLEMKVIDKKDFKEIRIIWIL